MACGSETYPIEYTTRKQEVRYHCCVTCGFTAKDPADFLSLGEEHAIYQLHNNSFENEGYVRFLKSFLDAAVLPYALGSSCLDFGSGPVPVLAQLLERDYGFNVDIYDKFYAPTKTYEGKTYDLITCTEVLEHIHDPFEVFSVFQKAMHPRSVLSLMTWFRPPSDSEFLRWSYIRDATHIAFYTSEALDRIAKRFDMQILYTDHVRRATLIRKEIPIIS